PERPAVLAAVTPFGARSVNAAIGRLRQRPGGVPALFRQVPAGEDLPDRLGPALTGALNVRSTPRGEVLLADPGRARAPLVVLCAAAAELVDAGLPERLRATVRRECRRSCLGGEIILMVYAGPVGRRCPDDAVLRALEACTDLDGRLVFTDTDANGRRL